MTPTDSAGVVRWKQPGTEPLFRIDGCGEWQYAPDDAEYVLASAHDALISTLRAELAEVRRERDVAHDIRRQLQAENVRLFSVNLAATARAEAAERERDRLAGSLAACGVSAGCDDAESFNKWTLSPDNHYWTDSLAAVTRLQINATKLRTDIDGLRPHAKWLRMVAAEMHNANWSNTCEQAAAAIDAQLALSTQPTASEGT